MARDLHRTLHLTSTSLQLLRKLCEVYQTRGLLKVDRSENGNSSERSSEEIATAERFKLWLLSHESTSSIESTLMTLIRGYSAATVFLVKELLHNQLVDLQRKMGLVDNSMTTALDMDPSSATKPAQPQRSSFYNRENGSRVVLFQHKQPSVAPVTHVTDETRELDLDLDLDMDMDFSSGLGAGA